MYKLKCVISALATSLRDCDFPIAIMLGEGDREIANTPNVLSIASMPIQLCSKLSKVSGAEESNSASDGNKNARATREYLQPSQNMHFR